MKLAYKTICSIVDSLIQAQKLFNSIN